MDIWIDREIERERDVDVDIDIDGYQISDIRY